MLSLIQSASTLTPAYNPVVYVLDSTNNAIQSYRYTMDIYNQNTSELLATLKFAPEPNTGYGYCDISKILGSYVTYDLDINSFKYSAPNSYLLYSITVGEEYLYSWDFTAISWTPGDGYYTLNGTSPAVWNLNNQIEIDILSGDTWATGLHTVVANSGNDLIVVGEYGGTATGAGTVYWANQTKTVSTGFTIENQYVFNGVQSTKDFISYSASTFIIPDSGTDTTRRLLTDLPDEFYCTTEQDLWLACFSDETNINTLRVRVANSNGDIFRTVIWNNSPDDDNITQFAIGPNNFSAETIVSGTLPLIKSNTEYYDFKIVNASNESLTQTYRIYIDNRCKIENYEILFMDRLGSMVSYAFQLRSKETGTIERQGYNQFLGTVDSQGWSYNAIDSGFINYYISYDKELELQTNWMTDKMSVYFEQLLTSPVTFLKDSEGVYVPIIIQDNGFEVARQKNKNLIKKNLKVKFSNSNNINI